MVGTGKVAATKLDETTSLAGSQFDDDTLMAMITCALESGVRSMKEFANVHSITYGSINMWLIRNGKPSWTELKELHGPTAPKKTTKKRKAAAKTGEKQTKKRK
jgi:hypothetical protein